MIVKIKIKCYNYQKNLKWTKNINTYGQKEKIIIKEKHNKMQMKNTAQKLFLK